jgi:hypothetical protein
MAQRSGVPAESRQRLRELVSEWFSGWRERSQGEARRREWATYFLRDTSHLRNWRNCLVCGRKYGLRSRPL